MIDDLPENITLRTCICRVLLAMRQRRRFLNFERIIVVLIFITWPLHVCCSCKTNWQLIDTMCVSRWPIPKWNLLPSPKKHVLFIFLRLHSLFKFQFNHWNTREMREKFKCDFVSITHLKRNLNMLYCLLYLISAHEHSSTLILEAL